MRSSRAPAPTCASTASCKRCRSPRPRRDLCADPCHAPLVFAMRRLIPTPALIWLSVVPLLVSLLAIFRADLARAALLLDAALLGLALLDGLLGFRTKVSVQRV